MKRGRPILVTGTHRGGTTFCGRILAADPSVGYVHEPFSKNYGMPEISFWFQYVRADQPDPTIRRAVSDLLSGRGRFRYPRVRGGKARFSRHLVNVVLGSRAQRRYRRAFLDPRVNRLLIKDPFAAFATEFIHREFGAQVVVVLRHPAAFVASVKEATSRHWNDFDFAEFLHQEELMEDFIGSLLEDRRLDQLDAVDTAALQWRCVYSVLSDYLDRNPEMIAVRHEDLAMDPIGEFHRLFERIGLSFTPRVRSEVERLTAASNRSDPDPGTLMSLKRNSRATTDRWREVLTADEIDRVRSATVGLASRYYTQEW